MTQQERRYLRPDPRIRTGIALAGNRAASACMDLSDGLADAARQIAQASKVGMTLDAGAIPIDEAVRRWHEDAGCDAVTGALQSGDDYELLFTVRKANEGRLRAVRRAAGNVPITRIGVVTREPRVTIRTADGEQPLPEGFEHFR